MAETQYKNEYEEKKAKRLAEKEKEAKKNKKKEPKKYTSMHERAWGKIIIFTLGLLMCASGLISLIYLIVQSILH